MRLYQSLLSFLLLFLFISNSLDAAEFHSSLEAIRIFNQLLKIPDKAPDVKVTVSDKLTEDGLLIEDIHWISPDEQEPIAFIIRPATTTGPLPAIICLHGTGGSRESMCTPFFGNGEWTTPGTKEPHQRLLGWARELARRGYLVLALTQRGLDVRKNPDTNDQAKDMLVRGRTLMGAIVYEIRQAVTHLQQRPDVDPNKIGVTGLSFGGITSFYTWLADDRVAAAAPICGGVGSVDVLLKKGSPAYHGFYWWIPDMLRHGDQGDFAAAMSPRPLMVWAPLEDIGMPKEGVEEFMQVVQPAYEKAEASGHLLIHRPPGIHEFSLEAFEAMVKFFDMELE